MQNHNCCLIFLNVAHEFLFFDGFVLININFIHVY